MKTKLRHFILLCGCMMTVVCQELLLHHAVRAEQTTPSLVEDAPILTDTVPLIVSDEYILSIANAPLKRERVLEAIATVEALDVEESNPSTILITTEMSSISSADNNDQIVEDPGETEGLCAELRRVRRQLLLSNPSFSRLKARIECDKNGIVQVARTPNDPNLSQLWGFDQDSDIDIDAQEAWDMETGQPVVIGVVDTGIDYTHPDLVANLWTNPGEIPANGVDDDQNGYVDDVHGINAINNSGNPFDDNGHGTHCAGTIAARGNNGVGVVGVHWSAKIVAAKFLASNGNGTYNDAVKALNYMASLAERGVKIPAVNNSWGGGAYSYIYSLENAISRLNRAGVVFVAAAGNASNNNDATPVVPADSPESNVISVAAIGSDGKLASFSNYGANNVDIAAPGVSIASTYPGNRYVWLSGTSMAAPHVSGAIALLASRHPELNMSQLLTFINQASTPLSTLQGRVRTNGLLNVARAITMSDGAVPITPTPGPTAAPTPVPTPPTRVITGQIGGKDSAQSSGQYSVANATVYVTINGVTYSAKSSSTGWFQIQGVPSSGNATVTVVRTGFTTYQGTFDLSAPVYLNVELIKRNYVLEIQIIDDEGEPIVGVSVTNSESGQVTRTNENGLASFQVGYEKIYALNFGEMAPLSGIVRGATRRVAVLP